MIICADRRYARATASRPICIPALIRVAGRRWRVEENFQAAKGLVGLDQHQVQRWTSRLRWTTLAMLAHACRHRELTRQRPSPGRAHRARHQRIPPPIRRPRARRQTLPLDAARLVHLASKTPSPTPRLPLPTPRSTMTTNYGCSTRVTAQLLGIRVVPEGVFAAP